MEELNTLLTLGPIVATGDAAEESAQESNDAHAALQAAIGLLEGRVKELEAAVHNLQSLRAQADPPVIAGRKTIAASQLSLLAKGAPTQPEGASVDDALRSLSIEQRIAVKSGLMRAGLMR